MSDGELDLDFHELSSAEDFLGYFGIEFDAHVVQVNRLHILQRFHDYLARQGALPAGEDARRAVYRQLLSAAYTDFVASDAQSERVFKVFHRRQPHPAVVTLDALLQQTKNG